MGCVSGKSERVYAVTPEDAAEVKKENGSLPTPQPVVSRDDYNVKHEGAHNQGESLPSPPTAPDPNGNFKSKVEEELLKVVAIDLQIAENAKAHHTDRYELTQPRQAPAPPANPPTAEKTSTPDSCPPAATPSPEATQTTLDPCLVVRRGQPFDIVIQFDRPFDSQKDDIRLVFDFGENPRESRGTQVVLLLSDEDEPKKWGAKVLSQEGETFTIRIVTPPHLAVNKWKFSFDTVFNADDKCQVFRHPRSFPVYILFNPWCADDQVYMSDESSRNEYVLNDCGRIFYGTLLNISAMPWNFGQFEDFVLDVAMLLLDLAGINSSLRGNSIHIVRNISAMTNAPDDNGVLFGNWSGDYSDGTSPVAWNGSVAILEEYWKTREPVRYGQCWVFSAVVTTICRALGIPCRSVTNFVCAHDTDGSLTVDSYWDSSGKPLDKYNQDTIWNFHVWNEVWMLRPDLPSGFGGWQAIDATPQEASEGVYCTGPASLEAVKHGLVQLPYDGTFIFAEVNADRIHCIQTKDGTWKHTFQENYIGKNISTKGPDGDERLDITSLYKFPEESQEERTAVWTAVSNSSSPRKALYKVEARDIDFSLVHKDDVLIGEPFDVILKIHNKNADQQRTVKATLTSTVVQYTGVPVAAIKSYSQTVILKPNADDEVKMTVMLRDYVDKVTDMCNIKIASMSQVEETKQFHCDSDDFRFSKPTIQIKVPDEMKLGEEYEIEASFTNPLPKALTQCEFTFEAASLLRPVKLSHADVPPQGVAKSSTKLTPLKEGETEMIIGFWSKELSDLTESAKVRVTTDENAALSG